jgi:hypothetical protein
MTTWVEKTFFFVLAKIEAKMEPLCELDDFRRKSMGFLYD